MKEKKNAWESTIKSSDTEEFIDIHFYRPLGYRWALFFHRTGVTPNQITIAAIFIGIAAGICFYFDSLWITAWGMLLLIWANTYDSADGQLARMTEQKSAIGRILDGLCGDLWFLAIYFAIIFRLQPEWGWKIWALGLITGFFHARQAGMADYYRNVHLLFLKGKAGSELDNSVELKKKYKQQSWEKQPLFKLFNICYCNYTKSQENWTPHLQAMLRKISATYGERVPESFRTAFRAQSFPLMKYTNMLSFNTRIIALFISLLIKEPWLYFVFELTALNIMLVYMVVKHEKICRQLTENMPDSATLFPALPNIKGILFDYGGTIDSNGKHWAEVCWEAYAAYSVPVTKEQFREAYVYGERYLAQYPVIEPHDNFLILLRKKMQIQLKYLIDKGFLPDNDKSSQYFIAISNQCYNFARSISEKAKPVIAALSTRYPLILVSNFYGNIREILRDFELIQYFDEIIESAIVGVRKPDPAIFALGIKTLGLSPEEVVVIGDAYSKDIVPAKKIGCHTIWLKGIGWDDKKETDIASADVIMSDFVELKGLFDL
jgi:FMN phosphatase YigB (HAD superfamily)